MRTIFLLMPLVFLPVFSFAQNAAFIRVRIASEQALIRLEGVGIRFSGESDFKKVAIPRNNRHHISFKNNAFEIRSGFNTQIIKAPYLLVQAGSLIMNGKPVAEKIILAARGSMMDVVAMVPLESYLLGVVASEVPANWPVETLKAQAIVARTYALATMRERWNKIYHVESTVLDQVYRHIGVAESNSKLVKSVVEAVGSTRGQYLVDASLRPIKAYFHADCGGVTASAKDVWGVASTEVVTDQGCELATKSQWQYYSSKKEISERLKKQLKMKASASIEKIETVQSEALKNKARVSLVKFVFSDGEVATVTSDKLRALLGYNLMKSAIFQIQATANGFTFVGRGHGHGVGLCQWGSKKLGSEGKKHQAILAHYYPKAKIIEQIAEFRTEQSLLMQTR